jgi:hypothetical protein
MGISILTAVIILLLLIVAWIYFKPMNRVCQVCGSNAVTAAPAPATPAPAAPAPAAGSEKFIAASTITGMSRGYNFLTSDTGTPGSAVRALSDAERMNLADVQTDLIR